MSSGKELTTFAATGQDLAAAEATVAPYLAGGVIERVLGTPEQSMDRVVLNHLTTIAMLRARGDTAETEHLRANFGSTVRLPQAPSAEQPIAEFMIANNL
jgi:hypothetical protein